MSDWVWDRKTRQLIESLHKGAGLETGLARGPYGVAGTIRGRYACRACGQDLIARALSPTAKQQPHFRHESSAGCPAPAERRRKAGLDDEVVLELRDTLVRAWPGVPVDLVLVRDPEIEDEGDPPATGHPPAIVVRGAEQTVVIEHVRTLPGADRILARQRAVRAQFGPGAAHVWFLAKDPMQFARCGKLSVAPRGRDRTVHATIAPTAEQLAVITAGGGVYWLDGKQVLIPYGVHDFVHAPEKGEAWDFPDWRRKVWPNDWRISHPLPEPDATRWGLVPLALHQMTGTKATFSLREAREVMQALEDVQRARWRRRRADARELHASRQAPPAPAPTSGPSPAAPVSPHAPELAQPRQKKPPPPQPQTQAEAGIGAPGAGTQSPTAQSATCPLPDRDGRPTGPVIPPLPLHPPLSPPPLPSKAPDVTVQRRQKGLRGALRQLLRKKHE
ncbi:hypothetical protein ACTFBT_38260 [Streptomyces microflavus]|uniref:hypothetical protein n=1 Tax=Streptomyces TaxID=1883 RepID=UPI00167E9296|nr:MULTISPECIES: hypothetical protein [Streptomyces]MDX2981622.1 hypothetical protein [Streptomyces sp. NRRL_B-2249]